MTCTCSCIQQRKPQGPAFLRFCPSPFSSVSVSHSLFLFRSFFVLSSRRFPFDSCTASFAFTFASLLSFVAHSVILLFRLGATPPPRAPCVFEVCLFSLRADVFFLSYVADVDLSLFFLLFLPFFDFYLDIVCFHPVFFLWVLCCLFGFGFCCDSFSI